MTKKNQPEEEIVYDEELDSSDTVSKLRKKLKEAVEEKQEYLDGWQRSKADFINFKKRNEEERQGFIKFALEGIILEIIPTLDSFDMALKNKEAWEKAPKDWRLGIEHIYKQLLKSLKSHGVEQINPIGENFSREKHDSIEEIEGEDGKIMDVTLRGYSLNGKIIRPAQVKVGNGAIQRI